MCESSCGGGGAPGALASRPCGLMDKALVFGTKDCRFESCQGQLFQKILSLLGEGVTPSLRNSKSGARAPMKGTCAEHPRMTWNMCPCQQTGYSSVGRASDCRMLQQSDGPWFDSGWSDFLGFFWGGAKPGNWIVLVSRSTKALGNRQ